MPPKKPKPDAPAKPAEQPGQKFQMEAIPPGDRTLLRLGVDLMLADPFPATVVKWKPQQVKNGRALAVAFLDARIVMDRLDAVVGANGWQDDYSVLPDGSVVCRLSVRLAGEWITKTDVGSTSDQPDGGDRMKSAFSDALKRAAVKFGVGRYIYKLPMTWVDYDPVKKRIPYPPKLPEWAVPKAKHADVVGYADEEPEPNAEAPASAAPAQDEKLTWGRDKWTDFWTGSLNMVEGVDEVNALLHNLKLVSDPDIKAEMWELIQSIVKPVFPYDAKQKKFVNPK